LLLVEPVGVSLLDRDHSVERRGLNPHGLVRVARSRVHRAITRGSDGRPESANGGSGVVRPVRLGYQLPLDLEALLSPEDVRLSVRFPRVVHCAPFDAQRVVARRVDHFQDDGDERRGRVVLIQFFRFPPCDLPALPAAHDAIKPGAAENAAALGRFGEYELDDEGF